MEEALIIERAITLVRDFAMTRARDVARGVESARLAGLLAQKYGYGVTDSVAEVLGSKSAASPIRRAVDELVSGIDPKWREHAIERWSLRPADLGDLSMLEGLNPSELSELVQWIRAGERSGEFREIANWPGWPDALRRRSEEMATGNS